MMDRYAIRGFSARYGATLSFARREELTRLILSEINQRRMEDSQ